MIGRAPSHRAQVPNQLEEQPFGPVKAFGFEKRRQRLDWRLLHSVDVDRVIRETDIDLLERAVETIAFGDIEAEDTCNFSEHNFIKIFRLSQLMVEYLLHNQDVLAMHKSKLLSAHTAAQRHVADMRHQTKEYKTEVHANHKEMRRNKKMLHTYEVMLKLRKDPTQATEQVHKCKVCDKHFESQYYLDLHAARHVPNSPSPAFLPASLPAPASLRAYPHNCSASLNLAAQSPHPAYVHKGRQGHYHEAGVSSGHNCEMTVW
ncbi:hypothetical protein CYMTET_36294 [Cymbomonas tetramitiformis]|uniref:C2H2-type domain-containing protein n=1 Tax=Cymbomonas tetramitiformis TaxID=36881 RepID=A0AAE0CG70_9CHLO|nr:hypothetical protein CYMTET_36294 [Cymbomonas tetramitiformis]